MTHCHHLAFITFTRWFLQAYFPQYRPESLDLSPERSTSSDTILLWFQGEGAGFTAVFLAQHCLTRQDEIAVFDN
jgi:hypothetical protein